MRISDWSSDVCSSDLEARERRPGKIENIFARASDRRLAGSARGSFEYVDAAGIPTFGRIPRGPGHAIGEIAAFAAPGRGVAAPERDDVVLGLTVGGHFRSEERRVGKGCVSRLRSRVSPCH